MKNAIVVAAAFVGAVALAVLAWVVIGPSGDHGRRPAALTSSSRPAVAMSWRGEWSQDERYAEGEVVTFRESAYVAERENGGQSPDPDCSEDCVWSLLTLQGPQGPEGPRGAAGPQGTAGPQGPPGNPLGSLDALRGLACNIGQRLEGIARVTYDPDTATVTLRCEPTSLYRLTVLAFGRSYGCGYQGLNTCYQSMNITVSEGGTQFGTCYNDGHGSATQCAWWVTRNATITLSGSTGTWGDACSGSGASCSVVMSADRVVSKHATS
jgi:hypothetical protein